MLYKVKLKMVRNKVVSCNGVERIKRLKAIFSKLSS